MIVSLIKYCFFENEIKKNQQLGIELCKKAVDKYHPDLILFPEMWSRGYSLPEFTKNGLKSWNKLAINRDNTFYYAFKQVASHLEVHIAITYLEKLQDKKPANTVSIINPKGKTILNYSKSQICDFGKEYLNTPEAEDEEIGCDVFCSRGKSFKTCTIQTNDGNVKIGAMICADREFPGIANRLFLNGAEIIIIPNSCKWTTRTFEILGGVAMANYPRPKNNGGSCAFDCRVWDSEGRERNNLIVKADEKEGYIV